MKEFLLIWDFDGVIADSEGLHLRAWDEVLKEEKQIILSAPEKQKIFYGVSDKTCRDRLEKYIPGLILDDDFMKKLYGREYELCIKFVTPIPGVEKVMSNNNFEHCIATGATREQHNFRMTQMTQQFGFIQTYIPDDHVFTVDMVEHGKPEPDLFLLAAHTTGHEPQNCIIVGDSLTDFKAATAAGMDAIAFIGANGNNTEQYASECKKHNVFAVCKTMDDFNNELNQWCQVKQKCA